MANNTQTAKDILPLVGDKENVTAAQHCMTRLRLTLRDDAKADVDQLKKVQGVAGCQFSGGQLQVIIGTNVAKVYEEFICLTDLTAEAAVEENFDQEMTGGKKGAARIVDNVFGYISTAVMPCLPVLITSGLVKTIVAIFGPDLLGVIGAETNLYTLLSFVGDAGMYFLPFFLAVGAAKKLNASWALGVYIAAIMLHPTFTAMAAAGASFTVFGIPCSVQDYSSSLMPILLSVWIMSYIEHFLRRHMPDALQVIAVPFITVVVMTPIALCVLGPVGSFLSNYICGAIVALDSYVGPLATMLIGGLFLPIVLTGMHAPLYVYLFATFPMLGYDSFFLPGVVASSWTLIGVFLAYMLKVKDREKRTFAASTVVTWLIGSVAEPFMFGVLLPNKKLLLASCAGGAIAGLVAGITGLTAHVLAASNGLCGLLAFLGGSAWNYLSLILTIVVSIGATFLICMVLKLDDVQEG